jgi:hypothetical protein
VPDNLRFQEEEERSKSRAIVVMNQAQIRRHPSKGAKMSFITDDIFRQATDEEINYMKLIVNEMKPNYHGISSQLK